MPLSTRFILWCPVLQGAAPDVEITAISAPLDGMAISALKRGRYGRAAAVLRASRHFWYAGCRNKA